jgi:hypothetical protein
MPHFRTGVIVMLQRPILDVQGNTVEQALHAIGFEMMHNVRIGSTSSWSWKPNPPSGRASSSRMPAGSSWQTRSSRSTTSPALEEVPTPELAHEVRHRGLPWLQLRLGHLPRGAHRAGRGCHISVAQDTQLPHDLDCIVLPGGFSYGDYLRSGAIARFSPIMREVIRFARSGGLVLESAMASRSCAKAGCCPGHSCATAVCALCAGRFSCGWSARIRPLLTRLPRAAPTHPYCPRRGELLRRSGDPRRAPSQWADCAALLR